MNSRIGRIIKEEFTGPNCPEFDYLTPSNPFYLQYLGQSFNFMRAHSDGKYSHKTLISLTEFTDAFRRDSDDGPYAMAIAKFPTVYDEETEIKSGGVGGMLIILPDGKSLLAVKETYRRQSVARSLMKVVSLHNPTIANLMYFWVGSKNLIAQRFLLSCHFYPNAINSAGAVRYSNGTYDLDN